MFGCKFRNFLFFNFLKDAFDCSKLFQNLTTFYIKKIYKYFSIINLNYYNFFFCFFYIKSSKFVIIVSGNLVNSKNNQIVGRPLDILYEEELLSLCNDKNRYALNPSSDSETLFLEGDTKEILNYLKCKNFEEVLNKNIILENLSKITTKNSTRTYTCFILTTTNIKNNTIIKILYMNHPIFYIHRISIIL